MGKLKGKLNAATAQTTATKGQDLLALTAEGSPAYDAARKQLALALPVGALSAERLLRVARTEILRNPKLLDCTKASVLDSLMIAAHLGLEVGGPLGHFYLVPFRETRTNTTKATPILGYKGMIVLARRSGEVSDVVARPVFQNDRFYFAYGLEDKLEHVPADGDRGKSVRYYGIARYTNGGHLIMVMSRAEVEKFRARSRAKDDRAWTEDYDAMACKTVIRRMAAFMPLATASAEAIAEDEERELGYGTGEIIDMPNGDGSGGQETSQAEGPGPGGTADRTDEPAAASESSAEADTKTDTAAAEQPARYVCPICGAVEDDSGHTSHDDAKHAEAAKAKRDAKPSDQQQEKLL